MADRANNNESMKSRVLGNNLRSIVTRAESETYGFRHKEDKLPLTPPPHVVSGWIIILGTQCCIFVLGIHCCTGVLGIRRTMYFYINSSSCSSSSDYVLFYFLRTVNEDVRIFTVSSSW
ncbi:hypothetical protein BDA99DRAFT_536661 [Phascolomyces articulosus]|uniref:Uncharacterized protein n=1 Tax=Phascolomyces articulosus TaxID=60185 RepID=A0AAD5K219_9FUNG|nr:hypothetical protein BDA99DRAFT_536661 [Phascolomyces articulosus]